MDKNFKSGFVALIGRPNVGKSTLMNQIIGQKIAITSKKPQTTRNKIQTVYTCDKGQIVFLDTPGIHKAKNKLGEYMVNVAEKTLKAFFKENVIKKAPVQYAASKRMVGEDGKPVPWEIRVLTNEEMDSLRDACTKRIPVKGTKDWKMEFDQDKFMIEMTLKSVVFPNLNDAELQGNWDAIGAEELLKAMLTPGELADLYSAVSQASDFEAGMGDKIKTVKNS